jgi:hypothetical protein
MYIHRERLIPAYTLRLRENMFMIIYTFYQLTEVERNNKNLHGNAGELTPWGLLFNPNGDAE